MKPFGRLLLWLIVLALFWCSAGTVLWNGARTICYHYAATYQSTGRDTIQIPAASLRESNSEVVWMTAREIRYHGRMFDIKQQITTPGETIQLVGYFDDTEDKLFRVLKMLEEDDEDPDNKKNGPVVWTYTCIMPYLTGYYNNNCGSTQPQLSVFVVPLYASPCQSPPAPPPDVVV